MTATDRALPVLVGVDAGATKSVAVAVTPDGREVGRADGDGANPKRHGLDVAAARIVALATAAVAAGDGGAGAVALGAGEGSTRAVEGARERDVAVAPPQDATPDTKPHPAPALLLVAAAGIDQPQHARALEGAIARLLRGTRIIVVNDTLAALRAGTSDAVGLVVPVSTGGNVIGRGPDGSVTDRGHGIFGGGYVLGALAARAARHGGVVAPLAARIDAANLRWHGRRPPPEAALLAADVLRAAEAGDPYPARMVDRWCSRTADAVRDEVERLGLGSRPVVILYGGLLDASPWLDGRMREAILEGAPGAQIRRLDVDPVTGAALLALDAWRGAPIKWDFVPRR